MATGEPETAKLDRILTHFMAENDFHTAQLGVLRGSQLVYAAQRGGATDGGDGVAHDVMPVLDVSKSLTAVAVLQLVERGQLRLDDRVFGSRGLLWFITPVSNTLPDKRLADVTIEHLLRHTAGWDARTSRLQDPLMNQQLVGQGHDVPDIAAAIGRPASELDQYDVIRYVIAQPLDYTPGERVATSNFGYCVLGQVIREVTRKEYADYVSENILVPAGMWHTRLGSSSSSGGGQHAAAAAARSTSADSRRPDQHINSQLVDSTLGWHSNVYDLARFLTSLYGNGDDHDSGASLLRPATLAHALQRDVTLTPHHSDSWPAALGMRVSTDGSVRLESSDRDLGLTVSVVTDTMFALADDTDEQNAVQLENVAIIFIGYTHSYRKHVFELHDAILSLDLNRIQQNAYVTELVDSELVTDTQQSALRVSINEHKLEAYVNAMRVAGYYVTWLHGYSVGGGRHTQFVAVFARATQPLQLQYKLMKSASKIRLLKFITAYSKHDYYVDAMQTLHSASHRGHLVHVVLMRRHSNPNLITFSLASAFDSYKLDLRQYALEGYQVVTQSVARDRRRGGGSKQVSYILQNPINNNRLSTRAFDGLSLEQLEDTSRRQSAEHFYVSYLDTYTDNNEQKFSVVFTQNYTPQEHEFYFETGIKIGRFLSIASDMAAENFSPSVVVSYRRDGSDYFAVQWSK